MSARLSSLLIGERLVSAATIEAAAARQRVYGGGLDTALLEIGALSEADVWARLAAVSGLPVPPAPMVDGSEVTTPAALPPERTRPLRAVPVREVAGVLHILCAEPVAGDDVRQAAAERGLDARLYIVPETRLLALRQRVYGETLPQRFAPLLAQAMGTLRARKSFTRPAAPRPAPEAPTTVPYDRAPDGPAAATLATLLDSALTPLERVMNLAAPMSEGTPLDPELEHGTPVERAAFVDSGGIPVGLDALPLIADENDPIPFAASPTQAELLADSATESLCRRVRDRADKGRDLALRVLRRRLEHPRAMSLLGELRDEAAGAAEDAARSAIETLADLRDEGAIPIFIHRLRDSPSAVTAAAERALTVLTAHAFTHAEQWGAWWLENAWSPRMAWLLAALGAADASTRRLALEELQPLSADTFGYEPDQPAEVREAARRRWIEWWKARGGAGLPEPDAPEPAP